MELVISINVFKSPFLLKEQLDNIAEHVLCSYIVILNCNAPMFEELSKTTLPSHVYINPEIINKKRHHGSLTHGIVSNMEYANQFDYNYFLILSGRTIFYRKLNSLDSLNERKPDMNHFEKKNWYWKTFYKTLLSKHYQTLGKPLCNSAHEGLCFTKTQVDSVIDFFNSNMNIKKELFEFDGCVEEFSLQTIVVNETNTGFMYIGNGPDEKCDANDTTKYVRKINGNIEFLIGISLLLVWCLLWFCGCVCKTVDEIVLLLLIVVGAIAIA